MHISPYELWNGRKPNLNYFKVWGCISYYRVPDHQRTKLSPRGIKSVFVGYAQHSKAYRLLDIESNVIIESIHVEFIENRFINDNVDEMTEINGKRIDANKLSLSEIIKTKERSDDMQIEPRKSQRIRKEKYLGSDFISSQSTVFLVE